MTLVNGLHKADARQRLITKAYLQTSRFIQTQV